MRYETVELDFVKRSLEILEQYEKLVRPNLPPDRHYEVTLLLNCLLGLVVLPFEYSRRAQDEVLPYVCDGDEKRISELDPSWGLDRLEIKKFRLRGDIIDPKNATLRQIVAMFRHSMAHSRFGDGARRKPKGISVHYQTAPQNPTESIITEVNMVNKHKGTEFIATIPVCALKRFVIRFAEAFLDSLQ